MVKEIAASKGKKVYLFSGLNLIIYLLGYFPGRIGRLINKAFGSLIIEQGVD